MKRSHDVFYLNENKNSIKQSFVEVADAIELKKFNSVADVGCAAGVFPNYLSKRFDHAEVVGIEYLQPLLKNARENFPHITFLKGNVLDKTSITRKFDVISMMGVLCIFDNYELVLDNVLSWLMPKGRLILHNMISDFDIDVFVKYTQSKSKPELSNLENGWNIISQKSLDLVAKKNNAKLISCRPFCLNLELEKQDDVMRSWTEKNTFGGNDIFNALHIRQPQKIAIIEKLS